MKFVQDQLSSWRRNDNSGCPQDAPIQHTEFILPGTVWSERISQLVVRPFRHDEPRIGRGPWYSPLSDVGWANGCSREVVGQQIEILSIEVVTGRGNRLKASALQRCFPAL